MKTKNLRQMFTAALLTLAATAAYSQDYAMTAKIPFGFRANGSDFPAGKYKVERTPGNTSTLTLRNVETGGAIFIPSKDPVSEAKTARPRLVFQCGGEAGCSLATLWSGSGAGLEFSTPPLTAAQKERRETVYLDRFKEK
jgi:hypothetical protein